MKIDNTVDHTIIPIAEDNKSIYIVTAYRWGERSNHSYVVGAYEDIDVAMASATNEEYFRGIKYVCEVVRIGLNKSIWDGGCETIKRITNDHDNGEIQK